MNYRILHDNGQHYGPVSADTLRQWIRDGRAGAQTRVQADGSTEWTTLGALEEFSSDLVPPPEGATGVTGTPKTSALAITSLVLGILGLFTCGITSLFGLILGIVGLAKIRKSQGQLSGNGLATAGIATSTVIVLFIAVFLTPVFRYATQNAQSLSCLSNLKQIDLSALIYTDDNNKNALPTAKWCDLLMPYLGTTDVLLCPAQKGGRCGYAYNSNLVGMAVAEVHPLTVMFFESDAGWNAVGGEGLVIQRPRHGSTIQVGLVDGSTRRVPASQVGSLRWEP